MFRRMAKAGLLLSAPLALGPDSLRAAAWDHRAGTRHGGTWFGDYDQNGIIELPDAAAWVSCSATSEAVDIPADCELFDADRNDRLDLLDFQAFQRLFGLSPPAGACVTDSDCMDGSVCTRNACDPTLGCSFLPLTGPCDDGDPCTAGDHCQGLGQCDGMPIHGQSCVTDADCDEAICNPATSTCICTAVPVLTVTTDPSLTDPIMVDEVFTVMVHLGASTSLVAGGQFLVAYDAAVLELEHVSPGGQVESESPFTLLLHGPTVDASAGDVFLAVGMLPGSAEPTHGPATMAVLEFRAVADAAAANPMCFRNRGLYVTLLTSASGEVVPFTPSCFEQQP